MNNCKYCLVLFFGLFLVSIASIGHAGRLTSSQQLEHNLKSHFHQYYQEGSCHNNIIRLLAMLKHYGYVNIEQAQVVIAEANDNALVVGNEADNYAYHVFLVAGERVFDPLMYLMFGKYHADKEWYFLNMFPYLRGVRFTSIEAQSYLSLDHRDIEMLFRDYDSREGLPLGQRRIQEILLPTDVKQIWRQPLIHFMHSLGWV